MIRKRLVSSRTGAILTNALESLSAVVQASLAVACLGDRGKSREGERGESDLEHDEGFGVWLLC